LLIICILVDQNYYIIQVYTKFVTTENIDQKEFAVLINNKNKEINHLLNIVNIINSRGGRVLTLYPPKIPIALGNEKLIEEISQIENVTKVTSKEIQKPEQYNLDDDSLFVIKSWNLRNTDQFKSTKTRLAKQETKSWDFEFRAMKDIGLKGPGLGRSGCNVPVESVTKGISLAPLPRNTSMFFSGTVAVGLIIVNGPTGTTAEFTNAEITKVISETQEGANNLITLSPLASRLKFVFDIKQVGLSLNPASVTGEENWRDPAMNSIGYTSGSEGLYAYVNYLRKRRWCNLSVDWGYIAFFTKYPTSWFAYASIGGPRLVMQYANDGWGPDQIDRVYAHESGHIFGAPDEYSNSNCNTGGSWGYLGVSNCNCEVSNPSSIDCLMKGNTYNLCTCTIAHFGWRDTDGDKLPDPLDKISFSVKTFSPGAGYAIPNGLWLTGDFDGDGRDDIVHAVQNTNYVHPWLSRGDGTFDVKTFSPGAGYAIPNGLWLVGDFNGDGRDDIVHAVQNTNYVHTWQSIGDGTFDVKTFSPGAGYAIPNGLWLVGDFDRDSRYDIVHAVQNTNYVHPWLSNGKG
jgi:hypothetical protein